MNTQATPSQLADQAAEAIRALNHITRSGDSLQYPSDVHDVVANLKIMNQRLPQLLTQLAGFLAAEHAAGRIAHDTAAPPGPHLIETIQALTEASQGAANVAIALDQAHSACGGLKYNPISRSASPLRQKAKLA